MDPVQRISLPAATADALEKIVLPTPVPSLEQFTRDPVLPADYNGPEKELMILKLFLRWVPDLQARYRALEIPETSYPRFRGMGMGGQYLPDEGASSGAAPV